MSKPNPAGSACYVESDPCSNPNIANSIGQLIDRRAVLARAAVATAGLWLGGKPAAAQAASIASASTLAFPELAHGLDDDAHVADGHSLDVLIRWGDRIDSREPAFDPMRQTAASQSRRFGYNCDFIALMPLDARNGAMQSGLLCVNHEYTNTNLMFSEIANQSDLENLPRELFEIEQAAHGHSVVEIRLDSNRWTVVPTSQFNRRLTATTPMSLSGPAAGHPRMITRADPTGSKVAGTLNNCSGGVTPWGSLLICEENFDKSFSGDAGVTSEARNLRRYGIDGPSQFSPSWGRHDDRFDIEREPHEPNRFGWIVEFDPYDASSVPVKRTALGRIKHEGAGIVVNRDGRVVVYSGDDERFEYIYRFVTRRAYDPDHRRANRDLLDGGVLSVARFDERGGAQWLPLVYGQGPLTADNGFYSQADVLIETRRAADLLGATPMDRPEDIEPSPVTGRVLVTLTNNDQRTGDQVDAANPRPVNHHGHILELVPPRVAGRLDHAADRFGWEVFLRAGDPRDAAQSANYHPATSADGWFSCPDNAAFDRRGRAWLTTDSDPSMTGFADGVYACDMTGPGQALTRQFFRGPRGSEVSGVCFSPDNRTMFVSVQHPGEATDSSFDKPATRWPDFQPGMPPRPAVVVIRRFDGGVIGDA